MKKLYNLADKLLKNPTSFNIAVLDKLFTIVIPFNAPHGFRIKSLTSEGATIFLPNRKLNQNHLGGVHACAMATLGEFCAGTTLLTSFGISKYRLILSELNVKYTYQGRTDLIGFCAGSQIDKDALRNLIESEGKFSQILETLITDKDGNEVAVVTTTWQLKPWDKVNTKA